MAIPATSIQKFEFRRDATNPIDQNFHNGCGTTPLHDVQSGLGFRFIGFGRNSDRPACPRDLKGICKSGRRQRKCYSMQRFGLQRSLNSIQ